MKISRRLVLVAVAVCVILPSGITYSGDPPKEKEKVAEKAREAQKQQQKQLKKQRERQREDAKRGRESDRERKKKEDEHVRERAKAKAEVRKEADKKQAEGARRNAERMRERSQRPAEFDREDSSRLAEANERRREQRERARERMNEETARFLEDRGRQDWERDRRRYEERARHLDTDDDAANLIDTILGNAVAEAIEREFAPRDRRPHRLEVDQVGRTPIERRNSVDYLIHRFLGTADYDDIPPGYHHDRDYPRTDGYYHDYPHYFDGKHRVVYYNSRTAIPPILLASDRLNRVDVFPYFDSPYRLSEVDVPPDYSNRIPAGYRNEDAYAVSYAVNPNTKVSRDDILFQQGETSFADAYSYDLVVDLAEAMRSSELLGEQFIIEGHASAEGDYSANLRLSQERAERIARDLVTMGVDPDRLIPVGYGETEARYPADAAENLRALDRRIMVFTAAE